MSRWIVALLAAGLCGAAGAQGLPGLPLPGLVSLPWAMPKGMPDSRQASASELGFQAEQRLDWAAARPHYERAVREAAARPEMFRTEALRHTLPRLARADMYLGRLDKAEQALQAWAALPSAPGQGQSGGFADAMRMLGAAMQAGMEATRALNQRLYVEGEDSEQIELALAPRLPATTVAAALWAELRARRGQHQEVLRLWQQEFQPQSAPNVAGAEALDGAPAVTAWRMAMALQLAGAHQDAEQATAVALRAGRSQLRKLVVEMPLLETQLAVMQQQRWMAETALGVALKGDPAQTSSQRQGQQAWGLGEMLAAKGLALRVQQQRRQLLGQLDTRESRRVRESLLAMEREVARLPTEGEPGIKAWADWMNRQVATLKPVMPALERAGLADSIAEGQGLLDRMRGRLQPDEALLGFIVHQPFDLLTGRQTSARYVRYTLMGDGRVSLRDLGPKRGIDQQVAAFRRGMAAGESVQMAARSLASLLLADLAPEVRPRAHWLIEAEGMLGLLPFEALQDGAQLLVEQHQLRYLSDAARLATPMPGAARGESVVVADPVYASAPLAKAAPSLPLVLAQGGALRDAVFQPLPETRSESAAVVAALARLGAPARQLLGAEASAAELRQAAKAPAYLHVASHGFVLSPAPQADPMLRNRVRMAAPGQLAGLVLSPSDEDPLLMGADLAAMNLQGTKLVVLSACDTGNGSVDVHFGLRSLRSAVEEAGAQASLTSLWPVPSAATVSLMSEFYAQLAAGRSRAEALQQAKLKMWRSGAGPREWAGFLLAGTER